MDKFRDKQILELKKRLGLPDTCLPLLQQAVTHPTFSEGKNNNLDDNQRLEFLGDAVLDCLVGEYLYLAYPQSHEGDLTKMRSLIVCEASLAAKAAELHLDEALRLGKGAELSGDRQRASVLADAMEAVIGAVYLSCGVEAARDLIVSQFNAEMRHLTKEDFEDKKSLLQELVQKCGQHSVRYKVLEISGPDHERDFLSGVFLGSQQLGQGHGKSKKESELAAADDAWQRREQWLHNFE